MENEKKEEKEQAKSKISFPKWYGIIIAGCFFLLQALLYKLGSFISSSLPINPFLPKVDFIDNIFKQVPVFIIIYLLSYPFWVVGPIVVSYTSKKNYSNFIMGLLISYFIGFIFFCFFTSYMDRNAEKLYDTLGNDIFSRLLRITYNADGKEMAPNLFPSYHCLISTYCYLGIRRQKEVHKGIRISFLILTILIICSTLFTKQHYLLDALAGVTISIVVYIFTNLFQWGRVFEPLIHKLDPDKK